MIDPYRVALWLIVGRVFLPNVAPSHQAATACDPKIPAALSPARRDSLARKAPTAGAPGEDRLASLAASTPGGFAGAYLESAGTAATAKDKPRRLIIRLARPDERDAALKALLPKIREIQGGDIDRGGVVVTPARLDLTQLAEWRRYLEPHAHAVAKVVSTDIDQAQNRLSYGVATPADRDALVEHLGTLQLPCGLFDVVVAPQKGAR
jgi:hypothetical protein